MKFVCRKCEAFMLFEEVEPVREESLGVTFECPGCHARISMVTNPGETQMVHALGVKLGGRNGQLEPLELTRQTLRATPPTRPAPHPGLPSESPEPGRAPTESAAEAMKSSLGKCPFANTIAGMQEAINSPQEQELPWTSEALARLERVPDFIRPFAKTAIEAMARQEGRARVDETLMDQAKDKFMKP